MGIETELKFRVPQRSLQILRSRKIPGSTMGERLENDLRSIYFDTPKLKLNSSASAFPCVPDRSRPSKPVCAPGMKTGRIR